MPGKKKDFCLTDERNPRDAALLIVLRVCEEKRKSHYAVREALALCAGMEARDRAFAKRTAEGTLDRLLELDYLLSRYVKKGLRFQNPVIRGILRISLYQILYMDRVPDHAVCNEAVALAKRHGLSRFGGFVNGVLRSIVRDKEARADKLFLIEERAFALSMPRWLYGKLSLDFGAGGAEEIGRAWLLERPAVLRLNRSLCSEKEAEALLSSDGASFEKLPSEAFFGGLQIPIPSASLPVFYALSDSTDMSRLSAFQRGFLQPQDMSAAIPALLASPKETDFILDICAAPGGKSLQLADMLCGRGSIEARDISAKKTALIEENIARSGFRNIRTRVQDALAFDEDSFFRADIVIADLPCSGLGIAARKPDIKLNLDRFSIPELAQLQRDMLRVAAKYVKPHGKLVYSTCTLTREENEENAAFIASELHMQLLREVRVFPGGDHDGFYAALFKS